ARPVEEGGVEGLGRLLVGRRQVRPGEGAGGMLGAFAHGWTLPTAGSSRTARGGGLADCRPMPEGTSNPEITPEVAARALAGSFPGDLGVELVELGDGHASARLAVDRRHLHPGGYVHGGVW